MDILLMPPVIAYETYYQASFGGAVGPPILPPLGNKFTISPFMLDTVAAGAIYRPDVDIARVDFIGYSNSGHSAELQDRDGNVITHLHGDSDGMTVSSGELGVVHGLLLPITDSFGNSNLLSGKLLVFHN